jgi:hypothetical protein
MQQDSEVKFSPQTVESDPTDEESIRNRYKECPSNECTLFAVHATKAWNLAHILLSGYLGSSEDELPPEVRNHRKAFLGHSDESGKNDDISFSVGFAERLYAEENPYQTKGEWTGGMGVVVPIEDLAAQHNVKVKTGLFDTQEALKMLQSTDLMEPSFQSYVDMPAEALWDMSHTPSTVGDLVTLAHIERKADLLYPGKAEAGMFPDDKGLPRLNLNETKILLPLKRKDVIMRYLQSALIKLNADVTVEQLLEKYPQIYWYPERNIDLAVKALSVKK